MRTRWLSASASLLVAGAVLANWEAAFAGAPAGDPIVIGQTLPLVGVQFNDTARKILAGVETYVRHVNATGGVKGRPLKVVTLDDENNPAKHVENLRKLVKEEGAVAIINCLGGQLCRLAAEKAIMAQVPLIGPMSGAQLPQGTAERYVFNVRPGYGREAEIMARQMATMGVRGTALITRSGKDSEQVSFVKDAFGRAGLAVTVVELSSGDNNAIDQMLSVVGKGQFDAAMLDVGSDMLLDLTQGMAGQRQEWPRVIALLSGADMALLASSFRGRTVGYTMVVPNPEASSIPLVREFAAQVERYDIGPAAISFTGLEAYINTRICVEALRRAHNIQSPKDVASALESLGTFDLGGFLLNFRKGQSSASSWVDVGVVSKSGLFLN